MKMTRTLKKSLKIKVMMMMRTRMTIMKVSLSYKKTSCALYKTSQEFWRVGSCSTANQQ